MPSRRRNRRRKGTGLGLLLVGVVAACSWWMFLRDGLWSGSQVDLALASKTLLTTDRPADPVGSVQPSKVTEKGARSPEPPAAKVGEDRAGRIRSLVSAGEQALARNEPVAARTHFSEAMALGANGSLADRLRAELTKLGAQTIFSSRLFADDPLVGRYVIRSGDTLGKIAKANKISADLLAAVNGIHNKNLIRAGQTLKLIHGPFHAVVDTKTYALDVYLGTTFVRHYRVGLGVDGSTPRGAWQVSTKLVNPTYYPPRGGRILAADDPNNPLGERWIGLEGVSGEAVGQQRYGIHGTTEPDSIGTNSSLGCIRMFNEDIEVLYTYLIEKHSTVAVQ